MQKRPAGSGRSERATVPLKSFMGLTNMIDVAGVPSAGTVFGRVAPTLKSRTGIESNIQDGFACDSVLCGVSIGQNAKLSTNTIKRILLRDGELFREALDPCSNLRPERVSNAVAGFSRIECRLC